MPLKNYKIAPYLFAVTNRHAVLQKKRYISYIIKTTDLLLIQRLCSTQRQQGSLQPQWIGQLATARQDCSRESSIRWKEFFIYMTQSSQNYNQGQGISLQPSLVGLKKTKTRKAKRKLSVTLY